MTTLAIDAQQLTKIYEKRTGLRRLQKGKSGSTAVQNVDLQVREGELFGLLGPNGAGKTTLVKMLTTLLIPTSGRATIAGFPLTDTGAIRTHVGLVVTDERSFYWRLSARRNLRFFAALHNMYGRAAEQRIEDVLASVNLLDVANQPFRTFSSGMKQRMAIARGLLHRPRILFLDEPTRSLDPVSTNQLHDLILSLMADEGMTVFLITHDLQEAEKLCDRVAVLNKGQIQAIGRADELRQQLQSHRHYDLTVSHVPDTAVAHLTPLVNHLAIDGCTIRFDLPETSDHLNAILLYLQSENVTLHAIDTHVAGLEELFKQLTTADRPNHS